jgi:WD40 repeat protein
MEGHRDVVSCITTIMTSNQESGDHDSEVCILSSSWDKTLKTWDLSSTGVMKTFDGHTDKVLSAALTSDAQYAVSGSADKTIR